MFLIVQIKTEKFNCLLKTTSYNVIYYMMFKISKPTVILNTKFNKFDSCGVCSITYE